MANNSVKFFKSKKSVSEIEQFEESIRKNPEDDRAYVRLAELYARAGRETKAIETYEKVAVIFEKKGFLERAKAVLKQALLLNPEHGKINVLLGDYYKQGGLVKDAAMSYNTAVSYYVKIGNKIAAINILRKMLELYPGNTNLSIKLANMLISEEMNRDAEKVLRPVAESLKNSEKVNEYVSVLKLLYTATDNDSEIGKTLVNFYLKKGSYSNALIVLQKLIVDNPDIIEFLEKLAFVFEKLGETQKLIATYKQMAVVYTKHKNCAERDEMYRRILELDPDDREALLVLNENAKLRDIISNKIKTSGSDVVAGGKDDFVIDVASEKPHKSSVKSAVKEARSFLAYKLFEKAIDKIRTTEGWENSADAYDVLIEAYIEEGKVGEAGEMLISLIDLKVSEGKTAEARELLGDAEEMLGADDSRVTARKAQIMLRETDFSDPESDDLFNGIANLNSEKGTESLKESAEKAETPVEPVLPEENSESSDLVYDETAEPPQERLDELEFYITIEDFVSATQLLKELIESFPNSKFLKEIKTSIPKTKGE
ncbi:tetratricopeptide repeat protein [bacterium]|nr:tetratricopeptide repeat protein [bacterium]